MNTATVSPTGGSVGIGFAIPSDMARRAMIRAIALVPPGATERLTIKRNREVFTLPVTVGRRPAELGSD
ncbi:MAG TPA: hypothetical protein VFN77_09270 [Acetobacteraceae bacterium]|nr:hypothetical protein [Acetobacteraceae bacterium]